MTTYLPRLADLLDPPAWHQLALCGQIGGDLWFPEEGEHGKEAKRICRRCEVRAECLEDALERDDYGIWAGLSREERRQAQREAAIGRAA